MTRTTSHGRRALAAACGFALAFASAQAADARLGQLDPAFDGDGIATPALPAAASLRAAAVGSDGVVYAGGSLDDSSFQAQMMVLRLTASGALDTSFGGTGYVVPPGNIEDGAIAGVALTPNGDVLAGGATSAGSIETSPDAKLFRITPAGAVTELTLPLGGATNSFVADVEIGPGGAIVLGGWATLGGRDQFMAIRLLPSGAADPSFSGDGVAFADFGAGVPARAAGVSIDATGRISLAGQAAPVGTIPLPTEAAAARFTSTGAADPGFNGSGQVRLAYPSPFSGGSRFLGTALRGETLLAAGSIANGTAAILQPLIDGTGGLATASVWQGGQLTTAESVATTSVGGAATAGRTGNANAVSLQTTWLTPAGATDAAGGGIVTHPIPLGPGSPPIGLALTPGDGTVVAATAPGNVPLVARFAGNAPPEAALAGAQSATAGTPVLFDAGGSSDPEGEALRFAFDLDGNGTYELDGGANPFAARSFPAAGTYTVGVRVTDPRGASATAVRTVAVSAAPVPPPQPLLGKQGVARPIRGIVRVRLPGTKRFVRLTELIAIPNGTEIDARRGRVLITVLHDASGRLDAARFYAGRFIFRQGKGATPITTLKLSGGSFRACRATKGTARRSVIAVASGAAGKGKKPVRKLWGDGRGRFRTRGRYGAATVRGTKWLTQDRCDGTRIKVERGKVDAADLIRPKRKPKRLGAGDAILIRKAR